MQRANGRIRMASGDGTTLISSIWCVNRAGICLSFAVSIDVMDTVEIGQFGKSFEDAVNESFSDILKTYFIAKSSHPLVCCTDDGELIMLWSFQGDDDEDTRAVMKDNGIKEIKYEK